MKIFVESNGNVHFSGDEEGKLELFTQRDVIINTIDGSLALKEGGGVFDDIEAYSIKVDEYLKSLNGN